MAEQVKSILADLTEFFDSPSGRSLLLLAAMVFGYHIWKGGAKDIGLVIIGGAWSTFVALLKPDKQ